MSYWLMKSEPSAYSWQQFVKDKSTGWSGVRNYQANNNMKAMKKGDLAFFYHSNEDKAIIGLMKITGLWHPDPSDEAGKFGQVTVTAVKAMKNPVTLAAIKAEKKLSGMALIKQSRLSVSPVGDAEARILLQMGGADI